MSSTTTPPALLAAMQTMLREAINKLVPPIVEQMLKAQIGTIIRGGRVQSGAMVGTIPPTVIAASLTDATTGAIGGVEIDQAPASGHPIAVTTPRIGAANGVASLDATGKVPTSELPPLGMTDPTTTRGDLIAHLSGGTGRLALGSSGQVLTSDGTDVTWATQTALTNPMTTQDDLIVGGASGAPARLAKGTSGQVLTVDATSGHLAWDTPGAGGSGALTKIAEVGPLNAAAATMGFTSIPQSYRNLLLTIQARTTTSNASDNILGQLNGDTAANYADQVTYATGGTVAANAQATTSMRMGAAAGGGKAAGYSGASTTTIPNYAGPTLYKSATAQYFDGTYQVTFGGIWKSSAAVTSLLLFLASGSFAVGSVATLYGMS